MVLQIGVSNVWNHIVMADGAMFTGAIVNEIEERPDNPGGVTMQVPDGRFWSLPATDMTSRVRVPIGTVDYDRYRLFAAAGLGDAAGDIVTDPATLSATGDQVVLTICPYHPEFPADACPECGTIQPIDPYTQGEIFNWVICRPTDDGTGWTEADRGIIRAYSASGVVKELEGSLDILPALPRYQIKVWYGTDEPGPFMHPLVVKTSDDA